MSATCSGTSVSSCIQTIGAGSTFSETSLALSALMYATAFIFVIFVAWKAYSGLGPDKVTFYGMFTSVIQAFVLAFIVIVMVSKTLS